MAWFAIIRVLIIATLFNLFLPTLDQYSEVALLIQTIVFGNIDAQKILECIACYGKENVDSVKIKHVSCVTCILRDKPRFMCAGTLCTFKILLTLENGHYCYHEKWRILGNDSLVDGSECEGNV